MILYERQEQSKGKLMIEIKDNGVGISASAQDNLFTEFQRGDEETQNKFKGTGLGLWISKLITESM